MSTSETLAAAVIRSSDSDDSESHLPPGYRAQSLPMWEVSEKLKPLVEKYGLQKNLDEMRDIGYTVIEGVPLDLCARIRDKIEELGNEEGAGPGAAGHAYSKTLRYVLGTDPVFAEAATYPPLLVMAEYLVGARFLLSESLATIKGPGRKALGLHTDQALMPTPYPEHMGFFTSCWVLDDWDEAHGATMVVPKSHLLRRYPEPHESRTKPEGAVPIVAKPGSIAIWGGATWHDSYARTAEGNRVCLHLAYARQCFTPYNDFHRLGKDYLAQVPAAMGPLLGEGLPYGYFNDNPEINDAKLGATIVESRS